MTAAARLRAIADTWDRTVRYGTDEAEQLRAVAAELDALEGRLGRVEQTLDAAIAELADLAKGAYP